MLEVHEPHGAFERIESWLRDQGFFAAGADDLVADVYLGYGLSSPIRRTASPAPPEPCPLPLAACVVRPVRKTGVRNDNGDDLAIGAVAADVGGGRPRGGRRRRAGRDRTGRRLPGQPRAAPFGPVLRATGRALRPPRPPDTTEPVAVRRRRLATPRSDRSGRSSPPRPSSSSRAAGGGCGRDRSRGPDRAEVAPRSSRRRRTPRST